MDAAGQPPLLSSFSSALQVSSETALPLPASEIWSRLAVPGHLPGEVLALEENVRILFRHSGTTGWLPISAPLAEYRLEPVGTGTRVSLELQGFVRPEDLDLVRSRLQGWADGSLAAFRSVGPKKAA